MHGLVLGAVGSATGRPVLLVTHDVDEALALDRVLVLADGVTLLSSSG